MTDPRPVVAYARQSISRTPDESLSIDFQLAECTAYAQRQGWVVTGTYSDPDTKGWRRNRPGFDAMLDAVRDGQASGVLVYKLSRFARNLMMQEEVVTEIARAGGELVSITEPHINTPMIRQILGAVNENLRRDQSDWLSSTFAARARRGLHHGYAPFGYRKQDKQLLIDDATAAVARQMWEWAMAGEGMVEITFRLNERNIPAPRAAVWTPSSVLRILRNPAYAGHVQHRGEVVARDTHPAIVTDAEYDLVQQTIDRRSSHRRKADPSWAEGYVYHACGERMYLAGWHRKDGERRPRFRCHRAFARERRGEMPCQHRPASTFASYAEDGIVQELLRLSDRLLPPSVVAEALERSHGASERERSRQRTRLEKRLADLERQRQRLLDLVLQDRIDPALYSDRDAALKVKIATVTAELADAPVPVSLDDVRQQHQRLTSLALSVQVVAAEQPSALVQALAALDARYVLGDGEPRLEIGESLRPYLAAL